MAEQNKKVTVGNGIIKKGRGGGQGKPTTPSGERKPWKRPANPTTPANRRDSSSS